MTRYFPSLLILLCAAQFPLQSATWHVSKGAGGDGSSPDHAFGTIQQAADVAKAGDTVLIQPGVYFESVQVRAKGNPGEPITFKADRIEKGRVILTGADAAIRNKEVPWTLEDEALQLYSIPWDKPRPTRVLYTGADLYPYLDLEHLRQFMALTRPDRMHHGPQHGFALDPEKKRLYVRLHTSGKYGSRNPNEQVMSISPPPGADKDLGLQVSAPSHYNLGVLGRGDAHIKIQGLTFETPGIAGVYTEGNDVTVSDCWFVGCRGGVEGTAPYYRPETFSYDQLANRVTVEYCEYTQFPTYDDGLETIRLGKEAPPRPENGKIEQTFWARKDVNSGLPDANVNYEVGIAVLAGRDWVVRRSHVTDAFEALSSRATTNSDNFHVYENVFERLLDNAVEAEDHSTNLHVYRNVIRDTFGPLSWQPLEGEPWPGPVFWYQNVIYNTPAHREAFQFRTGNVFKIGAVNARKEYGKEYLPRLAEPGIVIANNTVAFDGVLFWGAIWGNNPDKVLVVNNILITGLGLPAKVEEKWPFLSSENNLCAPFPESATAPSKSTLGGQVFGTYAEIGLKDPLRGDVELLEASPARDKSIPVPGLETKFQDLGALRRGDTWYPLEVVGPRSRP
jgi:hypothetical protein